ncbi:MAG: SDR family oxidoreductase [Sumerlaeia bacterium]
MPSANANQPRKKVVMITGATAGVGRATAHAFAERGWNIGLIARGQKGLADTKAEVEERGGRALALTCDVADADRVEECARQLEETFGEIDVWINNAMLTVFGRFDDLTPEEFRRVTEVTYLGSVYGTLAALKRMKPRDRGVIVQSGSALAYRSIPLQSGYCGAKHALRGFFDSLRCELLHEKSNVRLTMVQFPALNTPQFEWNLVKLPEHPQPVPPIFQPSVAAEALYWASQHRRREINVGLMTAVIIWGNKFLPAFGDWYLGKTGFDSQKSGEPVSLDRLSNLWHPVENTYGTRGTFDKKAKSKSPYFWVSAHRGVVAVVALLVLAGIAGGILAAVAA